ncbi:dihydrofolate reductase [Methylorubrum extorquens]|uniref:dihydrofolate reductase n=1 Tax=Methylorubrum extorquens TaxID=408 RepID=UPI0020A14091|nr:dihydrofolate reductase [Methylorubrum extorquens]MCP1537072.1 dihydrofolate reductase [Methylorubrum extorquens]
MAQPRISLVAAIARNGVIGRDNSLAWRLSSDLKRFKALTMGKPILMGRKTWDSIGRPLPGRRSLVITRDRSLALSDVTVVHDWDEALAAAGDDELMVVGGAEIYRLALPHADRLHLTEVDAAPEGDAYFPPFDRSLFRETLREPHGPGERDEFAFQFVDLERLGSR